MNNLDVVIVGAGASGLNAARELTRAGKNVALLEARNRIGGRIFTLEGNGFSKPIELGAEFVHGDLPLTQALLEEINVKVFPIMGKTYQLKNGTLNNAEEFIQDFDVLITKLKSLEQDIPFAEFLEQYFNAEQFADLKESVIRFAEGYDAADTRRASTFALREEWQNDGATNSYHLQGGYSQLINFLAAELKAAGCSINLSTVVKEIKWKPGQVEVFDDQGQCYRASKVLITVPLGVLQSGTGNKGYIGFNPELPEKRSAFKSMGFGGVIKILLEFKSAFWEEKTPRHDYGRKMPELAFVFADKTPFTAWWTQLPDKTPVLTGWLAGPNAGKYQEMGDENILEEALNSLACVFNVRISFLKGHLKAVQISNWLADPFARGAYAYATVTTPEARKEIMRPVQDTLFFAGEALYEGPAMGTVEAALASGLAVAGKILASS